MINPKQVPALTAATAAGCAAVFFVSCANNPGTRTVSASKTHHSANPLGFVPKIVQNFIPPGNLNRREKRKMKPRYITIHSTANQSASANAEAHVKLLHRAGLGRLSWHFTVDDSSIHQTLPTDEQGQHADYEGPGNRYSLGIEMCENAGNSRSKTMEQTAKLTAHLMKEHNIPINRVVPHQHWRRVRTDGKDFGHKNCPHFLMDDGQPGKKWEAFLKQVRSYL